MSDFDHAAAFAAQAEPAAVIGRLLAAAGELLRFRDWATTRPIPMPGGPKRTPDLVALLEPPDAPDRPALLIFEFQSSHDEEKLDTTLLEAAAFRAYARHGEGSRGKFRVLCGLVYLKGECPQPVLDVTLKGGQGTRHAPLLWEVGKDDAAAALESVAAGKESWGLLFWVPLMTGAERAGIIARWKELLNEKVPSAWMRGNAAGIALTFGQLTGRFLVWERALEGWQMGESQFLNRFRAEGELKSRRAILLRMLQKRYPASVSEDVVQMVEQQCDPATLDRWLDAVVDSPTFEDFKKTLR